MATADKNYAAQERQWRAQSDLRTLSEAETIKRETGRFKAAQVEARKQVSALTKVVGRKK